MPFGYAIEVLNEAIENEKFLQKNPDKPYGLAGVEESPETSEELIFELKAAISELEKNSDVVLRNPKSVKLEYKQDNAIPEGETGNYVEFIGYTYPYVDVDEFTTFEEEDELSFNVSIYGEPMEPGVWGVENTANEPILITMRRLSWDEADEWKKNNPKGVRHVL